MKHETSVVVTGVSGRMGQMLIKTIDEFDRIKLVGAIEQPGHSWVGTDLGIALGRNARGIIVADKLDEAFAMADAILDFTTPQSSVIFAHKASHFGIAHVIGTTGITKNQLAEVKKAAKKTTIVRAGNMSLGVNLLVKLTKQVAKALDTDFDIEVIEAHHNKKVDAPSGTALMLGEAAAEGRGQPLEKITDKGRNTFSGVRKNGDIGFVSIRGGDIVGEHDVLFASPAERITLRHVAQSRDVFARGAIKAAEWAKNKAPGEYDMLDVLGLNSEI